MGRTRRLILVLGPIVIVSASMVGALVTSSATTAAPAAINQFLVPAAYPAVQPFPADAGLIAACRARARELRDLLEPGDSLLVEPPFVIAGTMSETDLHDWYTAVIFPAAAAMRAEYFDRPPDAPVTLILLEHESSYRRYAARLAGEQALGYFGYYDSKRRTAVANVATGAGTLLHEMTHALMEFDFPQAPAWFAEGLAALHEQCRLRKDRPGLEGLENWRTDELRALGRSERLASLKGLVAPGRFRGPEEAANYAYARGLLLYLQRQGALDSYYRRFRDGFAQDPTGYAFLEELRSAEADESLDDAFLKWVTGVSF